MKIAVVNASNPVVNLGNDSYVDFREYDSWQDAKWRSWHSIPAALKTEFFACKGDNFHRIYEYDGIILLVNHQSHLLIPFVKKLKKMGKIVCVGYHESFDDFMLKASDQNDSFLDDLSQLMNEADAYWNVIPSASNVFMSLFRKPVLNVIHGAPIEEWDHGLSKPVEEREGILIATRTMDQRIRRNTLVGLTVADLAAYMADTHVTYVAEGSVPELAQKLDKVRIIDGPLPYVDWLKLIAKHKLVFHYDTSHTLGQVVMDAALVGVPCIGGNSENNVEAQNAFHLRNIESCIVDHYNKSEVYPPFVEKMKFSYLKRHVLGSFKALAKQLNA